MNLNNIIHRDIKPENLVFDENGYLKLADFGIARRYKKDKMLLDTSGTPGYMAPEILLNKTQNYNVDYFSLGVVTYELVFQRRPYKGRNRKEIIEKMLYREVNLKPSDAPDNFDLSICDFINKLLKRKQKERLGNEGIKEIMDHPWLSDINWEKILCMEMDKVPFKPKKGDNFDIVSANKEDYYNIDNYETCLRKINGKNYFSKFYFNFFEENSQESTKFRFSMTSDESPVTNNYSTQYLSPEIKASRMLDNNEEDEEIEFELEGNFSGTNNQPSFKNKTNLRRGWSVGHKIIE